MKFSHVDIRGDKVIIYFASSTNTYRFIDFPKEELHELYLALEELV